MKKSLLPVLFLLVWASCKIESKSTKDESLLDGTNHKTIATLDSTGAILLSNPEKLKSDWEGDIKSTMPNIELKDFKIIEDHTDDATKESFYKIIAIDESEGIIAAKWLKKADNSFVYFEDLDLPVDKSNQSLSYLIVCKSCSVTCGPVLFKVQDHYYWGCELQNDLCEDCSKTVILN